MVLNIRNFSICTGTAIIDTGGDKVAHSNWREATREYDLLHARD